MFRHTLLTVCAVLALLVLAPQALAQESWVGKKIMTKEGHIKIGHTDENGKQVYVGKLTHIVYTVLGDKDGWLKVRHNAAEGWFDKNDAVLLENAIPYFTQKINANPNDDYAFASRGEARSEKGEYDIAIKDISEAIRLKPTASAWWNNRGVAYDRKKDYDKAISDYNEAIRLDPKYALAYNNRGIAYRRKNDHDKAISDYNEAIQLDPKFALAYNNRGVAYDRKEDYEKAIGDYNEAIRLDPKFALAYRNRGVAYAWKYDYNKAISDYNEAIRLDSKDADGYNAVAWLLATCPIDMYRDGKKAVEYATKACELSLWKEAIHVGTLGAAYAEAGQFDEAVKYQLRALEDPDYAKEYGEGAKKRLELYKNKKPYRED